MHTERSKSKKHTQQTNQLNIVIGERELVVAFFSLFLANRNINNNKNTAERKKAREERTRADIKWLSCCCLIPIDIYRYEGYNWSLCLWEWLNESKHVFFLLLFSAPCVYIYILLLVRRDVADSRLCSVCVSLSRWMDFFLVRCNFYFHFISHTQSKRVSISSVVFVSVFRINVDAFLSLAQEMLWMFVCLCAIFFPLLRCVVRNSFYSYWRINGKKRGKKGACQARLAAEKYENDECSMIKCAI